MTPGVASAFHGDTHTMGGGTPAPAKLATGTYVDIFIYDIFFSFVYVHLNLFVAFAVYMCAFRCLDFCYWNVQEALVGVALAAEIP